MNTRTYWLDSETGFSCFQQLTQALLRAYGQTLAKAPEHLNPLILGQEFLQSVYIQQTQCTNGEISVGLSNGSHFLALTRASSASDSDPRISIFDHYGVLRLVQDTLGMVLENPAAMQSGESAQWYGVDAHPEITTAGIASNGWVKASGLISVGKRVAHNDLGLSLERFHLYWVSSGSAHEVQAVRGSAPGRGHLLALVTGQEVVVDGQELLAVPRREPGDSGPAASEVAAMALAKESAWALQMHLVPRAKGEPLCSVHIQQYLQGQAGLQNVVAVFDSESEMRQFCQEYRGLRGKGVFAKELALLGRYRPMLMAARPDCSA